MDGRIIGTVVLPDAQIIILLPAWDDEYLAKGRVLILKKSRT